jgi:4-hydroxy-tetrahydrodipicolinate reductase
MDIIISGYGKMGREIEKIALQKKHSIFAIIDHSEDWVGLEIPGGKFPVVIDFSQPDVVVENIKHCFDRNLPMVIGTTGWDDFQDEIFKLCRMKNQTMLVASNFSIGMNIFFALNKYLASVMDQFEEYEVFLSETHHIHKADKPSGTAVTLARQILDSISRKEKWSLADADKANTLSIDAKREGDVFGDHSVKYTSEIDDIEIKHSAKNRKGFAFGAIRAAEWLQGQKGIFTLKDVLGF